MLWSTNFRTCSIHIHMTCWPLLYVVYPSLPHPNTWCQIGFLYDTYSASIVSTSANTVSSSTTLKLCHWSKWPTDFCMVLHPGLFVFALDVASIICISLTTHVYLLYLYCICIVFVLYLFHYDILIITQTTHRPHVWTAPSYISTIALRVLVLAYCVLHSYLSFVFLL